MRVRDSTTPGQTGEAAKPDRADASHGAVRRGSPRRSGGLVAGVEDSAPFAVRRQAAGAFTACASARQARGAAPSVTQVLLGGGPRAAEARIRIADGRGGSAEIRLASVAGRRDIAVQVLTGAAGSRETLTGVMNEVRLRLRRRGIALTDVGVTDSPAARDRGQERTR
ncbi:MAG TPA: hypothetical protein VLT58_02220 [Polyangia bacterium]|nr:hypothetical protein [Polyangia bacterium]